MADGDRELIRPSHLHSRCPLRIRTMARGADGPDHGKRFVDFSRSFRYVTFALTSRTSLAVALGALVLSIASFGSARFCFDRYRGKVLFVNFFASWCPPCNREAPTLAKLARSYASRGWS